MIRICTFLALLMLPVAASAGNREAPVDMERGSSDIRSLEKETALERDLLGRKVVIDPDSQIDPGSLLIEAAPGSTVIVKAKQYNRGIQRVHTPLYTNVEMPSYKQGF